MSRILSLMESHLSALALGLQILGGAAALLALFGFKEIRDLRKLREQAQGAVDEARRKAEAATAKTIAAEQAARGASETVRRLAEQAHENLGRIRGAALHAMEEVDRAFVMLPELEVGRDARAEPPAVPADISLAFEDADPFLVLCDRLGLFEDRRKTAAHLRKIGRYWRIVGNFPRSLARIKRAVALAPDEGENHLLLGQTLARQAARDRLPADEKRKTLEHARSAIHVASAKLGREDVTTLRELAWISYEQGAFADAAEAFKRARDEDRQAVERRGAEIDWRLTYNLASSLAQAGQHHDGLTELEAIISACREHASSDPAFDPWRQPPWNERFLGLLGAVGPDRPSSA